MFKKEGTLPLFTPRQILMPLFVLFGILGSVFLFTPSASALTYKSLDVAARESAYESALIIRQCLTQKTVLPVSNEGIKNYQFVGSYEKWVTWNPTLVNYHASFADDNEMSCNEYDYALIKGAFKRLELDPIAFLCEVGGKRTTITNDGTKETDCMGGSGTISTESGMTQSKIDAAIKKFTGLDVDNPGNEVRYLRSLHVLEAGCFGSETTATIYNQEPPGKRWKFTYVDGAVKYFLAKSAHNEKPRGANGNQKGTVNCIEYWNRTNTYKNDYQLYLDRRSASDKEADDNGLRDAQTPPGGDPENETNCVLEGIGWIVCPVVTAAAKATDALYSWISNFLVTQPLNMDTGSSSNTTYIAWSIIKNIANIAFVIAFLFIIFSQLTGAGISNYGVKKMLPRLVIAAILVNLSYWIAAVAVDLSNIIGNNTYNILRNVDLGDISPQDNLAETITAWILAGGTVGLTVLASIPILATAGGTMGIALFWAVAVIALSAALALLVAFVVMALRQAIIIILIVLAPLAFVAFLLPNTEKYFTMWRKSLLTLLIFYPLFSLLFGGSYVASMVIIGSAGQGNSEAANGLLVVIGMAVQFIPLFLTPMLIKFSSGIMGQVAGIVNNKGKGLIDRSKNARNKNFGLGAREGLSNPRFSKNPFNRGYRAIENKKRSDASREAMLKMVDDQEYANTIMDPDSKAAQKAGGIYEHGAILASANANSVISKANQEAEAAVTGRLEATIGRESIATLSRSFQEAVGKKDELSAKALQGMLLNRGNAGLTGWQNSVASMEASGAMSADMAGGLKDHAKRVAPNLKAANAAANNWATTNDSLTDSLSSSKTWTGLSNEEISSQKPAVYQSMFDALQKSADGVRRAQEIQATDNFTKLNEQFKNEINKLANSSSIPPSQNTPSGSGMI